MRGGKRDTRNDRDAYTNAEEVLAAIHALIQRFGWPPSIDEIGAEVGLRSKSTVWYWLDTLETRGWITRGPKGQNRALRITDGGYRAIGVANPTTFKIPIRGRIFS